VVDGGGGLVARRGEPKRMAMTGVGLGLFWLVSSPCHYHDRVAHAFATLCVVSILQFVTLYRIYICSAQMHNTRLNVFVRKKDLYYAMLYFLRNGNKLFWINIENIKSQITFKIVEFIIIKTI
jgi:hypothetical protein